MAAVTQRAIAMVSYEDVAAAAAWLTEVFGFREDPTERLEDGEGRVTHVVMTTPGGGVVFLGWPGPEYQSPTHHRAGCEAAARWLDTPFVVDGVLVYLDAVDAHAEIARAAGARIIRGPEAIPIGRLYSAEDVEGHRWMFMQARDR
jgi:uncharacterized glyoxalase superfamily protein PhnB